MCFQDGTRNFMQKEPWSLKIRLKLTLKLTQDGLKTFVQNTRFSDLFRRFSVFWDLFRKLSGVFGVLAD